MQWNRANNSIYTISFSLYPRYTHWINFYESAKRMLVVCLTTGSPWICPEMLNSRRRNEEFRESSATILFARFKNQCSNTHKLHFNCSYIQKRERMLCSLDYKQLKWTNLVFVIGKFQSATLRWNTSSRCFRELQPKSATKFPALVILPGSPFAKCYLVPYRLPFVS
jgi:hypothetical protein